MPNLREMTDDALVELAKKAVESDSQIVMDRVRGESSRRKSLSLDTRLSGIFTEETFSEDFKQLLKQMGDSPLSGRGNLFAEETARP